MRKIMALLTVAGRVEGSLTPALDMDNTVIATVKSKLKPGETLKDLFISCTGRVDLAQQSAARWKAALPVEGEVTCSAGGLMDVVAGVWGQYQTVQYWI